MVRLIEKLGVGSWEWEVWGVWGVRRLDSRIQVKMSSDWSEQDNRSTLSLPFIDCEFLYHPNSYFYDFNYHRSNS